MNVGEDIIFQYIVAYIKENQCSPTYREISKAVRCSTSTLLSRLNKLQMMGKIEMTPKLCRSIKVPGYQFVETTPYYTKIVGSPNSTKVVSMSAQDRKELTTLADDFCLLHREDVQKIIETCKSYEEGRRKIMRVYENVYM